MSDHKILGFLDSCLNSKPVVTILNYLFSIKYTLYIRYGEHKHYRSLYYPKTVWFYTFRGLTVD